MTLLLSKSTAPAILPLQRISYACCRYLQAALTKSSLKSLEVGFKNAGMLLLKNIGMGKAE